MHFTHRVAKVGTTTCRVCQRGRYRPGFATITATRNFGTIVFQEVPAHICDACGHRVVTPDLARELEQNADALVASGVHYMVRDYPVATPARAKAAG